jgi:hypothetical protein
VADAFDPTHVHFKRQKGRQGGVIDFAILLAPVDGVIEKGEKGGRISLI